MGVCICCLHAQPAPYGGSSTMGRHETSQTAVGRPSTYCHWFGAHSGRGPACLERRWTLVPVGSNRFGMHCYNRMLLMFFASRRIEKQRLKEYIERCRVASRFVATLPR